MSVKFGEKLRHARQQQRMTQAQLGNGKYSTSYVSLLETGSREPTAEIITELSTRLGIERDVMEAWNTPVTPDEAEFVLLEHRVRASLRAHDYGDSAAVAKEAAAIAHAQKNSSAWWNMTFVRAEALRELGEVDEFLSVAAEVLAHPLTDESPALTVRAHTLVSHAQLAAGRLHIAVDHALRATDHAHAELPSSSLIALSAQFALVASLTETGQLDKAWAACLDLNEALDGDVPAQTAGSAHWTIGNVAFRRQDVMEGLRHHDLAAQLLRPASDIELWTRFNKASASARLTAGVVAPATLACIERAEVAQSVIGAPGTEGLELRLIRARWDQVNGMPAEALEALAEVDLRADELPDPLRGEASLLTARCLLALARSEEALEHLSSARDYFGRAGAGDRAMLAAELATQIRSTPR